MKSSHVRGLRFSQDLFDQVEGIAADEKRSFANAAVWLIEMGLSVYYAQKEELERLNNPK
jgi:hypothetical protein